MNLTKRQFLKVSGAASALALVGTGATFGQSRKLAVNTYGGLYANAVNENFVANYIATTGGQAEAITDIPSAALSKIRATMPRPEYDLFVATSNDTLRAIELDLVEPLDMSRLPGLKDVPAASYEQWQNMAVSFSYGTVGFLYDTRAIANPPKDWVEFVERTISGEFGRNVVIPSGNQASVLEACVFPITNAFGGTIADPTVGYEKIAAMTPYISGYYSDMAEVVQMLANGEATIAIYIDGRSWAFVDQNPWANFVVPAGGGVFQSSQVMKVKGSPAEAWDLMNSFIATEPAEGFVNTIKYPVTNIAVKYPDEMKGRVTKQEDILYPPFAEIAKATPALIERWNKEIGG